MPAHSADKYPSGDVVPAFAIDRLWRYASRVVARVLCFGVLTYYGAQGVGDARTELTQP